MNGIIEITPLKYKFFQEKKKDSVEIHVENFIKIIVLGNKAFLNLK